MAQSEDTELRDLVIEALEKNGSLAKIRALLRANVFLAFENECENVKQNATLDNILKLPEGILALSIIHEFLEFCNLKNTLFVYMAESRQKKDYIYEGTRFLCERLNLGKQEHLREPILISLLRSMGKTGLNQYSDKSRDKYKDDQNCTYIVHEDSSTATSNSHSDNSSDERNKLHLRLNLDNSDTDTSSDSARDKSSSEYIPNAHIASLADRVDGKTQELVPHDPKEQKQNEIISEAKRSFLKDTKLNINSSSESTSYLNIKPFDARDHKLINTAGLPSTETFENKNEISITQNSPVGKLMNEIKSDSNSPSTLNSVSSMSNKTIDKSVNGMKTLKCESGKSEVETGEYSMDFVSSPTKDTSHETEKVPQSSKSLQDNNVESPVKETSLDIQDNSQSSQSSVSISDVVDLLSEKSTSISQSHTENIVLNDNKSKVQSGSKSKSDANKLSDDSGDFSESPIPSLSNLSLDIHSD